MKTLKENFFGNLGIGKRSQVEKWLKDNKKAILGGINIDIDGNSNIIISISEIRYIFYSNNIILEIPEYIQISHIILKKGSYNHIGFNNLKIADFNKFIGNAKIIIEHHNSLDAEISFNNCNIKTNDLCLLPKEIVQISIDNCNDFSGDAVINKSNINMLNIKNCKLSSINVDSSGNKKLQHLYLNNNKNLNIIYPNKNINFLSIEESELNNDIIEEIEKISAVSFNDIKQKKVLNKINKSLKNSILLNKLFNDFPKCYSLGISVRSKYKICITNYYSFNKEGYKIESNEITDY